MRFGWSAPGRTRLRARYWPEEGIAPNRRRDRAESSADLPPLIVIVGPTATGKTAVSLAVADAIGDVEIVSADSRQVYRGMDVGTAKVASEARRRIPHHGLDLVDPDEPFSVAAFQRHARSALRAIDDRGRVGILVGGTGLYVRAVARGFELDEARPDEHLRAEMAARLEEEGVAALAAELQRTAPAIAAATDLRNPRRVVRALERVRAGGDRLPAPPRGYPAPVLWLGLDSDRSVHSESIHRRAAEQFRSGLLDEAGALLAKYSPDLPAFSAFGYREAMQCFTGNLTVEQAVEETSRRTRAYARRQRTWFRAEPEITWLDAGSDPVPDALGAVRRFLDA